MIERVGAVAAVAAALLVSGAPVAAQTYPPPVNSITVDDNTPAPGQAIAVTLRTCRAGTTALIGIDLRLLATPVVDADGAARASVTVPADLRPGPHKVTGVCRPPQGFLVVVGTTITVTGPAAGGDGGSDGNQSDGAAPGGDAGGTDAGGDAGATTSGSGTTAQGGSRHGGRAIAPAFGALDGALDPDKAGALYEDAVEASVPTAPAAAGDGAVPVFDPPSREPVPTASDPGPLSTVARVTLGVAALGGVPVALAVSRRPRRVVRRRFA